MSLEQNGKQLAKATVVKVVGQTAWVETIREGGCHSCGSQKSCGTSALAMLFSPKQPLLKVENTLDVTVGQTVMLSLNDSDFIKHSIMAYGVPLILLFTFAGLVQFGLAASYGKDLWVALAGFVGLGVGWWATHYWYRPVMPKLETVL